MFVPRYQTRSPLPTALSTHLKASLTPQLGSKDQAGVRKNQFGTGLSFHCLFPCAFYAVTMT